MENIRKIVKTRQQNEIQIIDLQNELSKLEVFGVSFPKENFLGRYIEYPTSQSPIEKHDECGRRGS